MKARIICLLLICGLVASISAGSATYSNSSVCGQDFNDEGTIECNALCARLLYY